MKQKASLWKSYTPRLYVKRIIYTYTYIDIYTRLYIYISIELSVRWQKAIVFMKFVGEDETRGLPFYFSILSLQMSFVLFQIRSNTVVEQTVLA